MKPTAALAFVREHGIVLASGKGPHPSVAEFVAGGPIKGSWWAHAKSHEIFRALQALGDSPEVLVCRLVKGKVSLVHERLWPALVRVAARFPSDQLAQVRQEHTARGHHVNQEVPFPKWVPPKVMRQARSLSEDDAIDVLRASGVQVP